MSDASPILEIDSLSKAYRRRRVLDAVSLQLAHGQAIAVAGPNGAGKSTLMGCLTGDRVPDSGAVRICTHDPFANPAAAAACMGFVPENPFLYGELTVIETIRFVAELRGLDRDESERAASRLLERFGLAHADDVLCRELSQGMGRKTAIVIALLHQPALLILDEVFNGLDQPSTEVLLQELRSHRENGGALLISSHDLTLLAGLCDRGLLLAPDGWSLLEGEAWERWQDAPVLSRKLS
ncbi:MAG: ABC transporter ATP-binding protein [Gemmatimonadota bacterium]